jgi:hypothetical protein
MLGKYKGEIMEIGQVPEKLREVVYYSASIGAYLVVFIVSVLAVVKPEWSAPAIQIGTASVAFIGAIAGTFGIKHLSKPAEDLPIIGNAPSINTTVDNNTQDIKTENIPESVIPNKDQSSLVTQGGSDV